MKTTLQDVPFLILDTPLPYDRASGIVTIRIPKVAATELAASLMEHERILVGPAGNTPESIRISTHVFNTDEEIERLVSGLRRVQRAGF